ncbi:mannonate dehydratase [Burkholderia pseudomallei]|uniref:mannonate dehydratase n=1 Tax=Burkholderia pseudomallei TaxID=28450 RepID=A0AA40MH22_BURPE|nr:mannonate dehydratase [Burkholderia pseudomallei]KGS72516.1 D-mannonate dehydratase family protein [Burkholderia pseudomallei MSHR5596]KGW78534.1 D-mannonate dehydratase family protein [Burkholderia pseudomallei MSHR2990]KGX17100.1 D-mannonate dehydratase family protein [Burkholderia pseudomallei]
MKIGLGLYRNSLNDRNYTFAKQAGASHIVAHLTDYFGDANPEISRGDDDGWGIANNGSAWSEDDLKALVADIRLHGLELAAIENFNPAQWHDILLDGPRRDAQIEVVKETIRAAGSAGVPTIGYNFSIAGVWGWTRGPYARGGAMSVGFDMSQVDLSEPIPDGMVWNMRYRARRSDGVVGEISSDELWERLRWFLERVLPVAEDCGVNLALHPDDPPVETMRGAARLVNLPEKYDRLIEISPSPSNRIELCLGSVQEMRASRMDVYQTVDKYTRDGRVGYIHFRNVKGKVPKYREVFVDEGDIDMARIVAILHANKYEGVLIPDHTPALECDASWHAGMAYALGYMRALVQLAQQDRLPVVQEIGAA